MEQVKVRYQEFLEACIEQLKIRLGTEYNIQLNTVLRNNAITMKGVIILKNGEKISPNIYLDEYFTQYEQGKTLEEVVDRILILYYNQVKEKSDFDLQFTFEAMKDNIIFRVINKEKNEELLKDCPHVVFLDLAVTFHCLIQDGWDSIGTIRITNDHLRLWQVSEKDMIDLARKNTPKLLPPLLRKMDDVLKEMLEQEDIVPEEENLQLEFDRLQGNDEDSSHAELFVLSNTKGINGASCILYEDAIRHFAKLMKSDLYILPSSIHELILLPTKDSYDKERLEEMVIDINRTQVPYEEVLSDHIYYYSRIQNKIKIL